MALSNADSIADLSLVPTVALLDTRAVPIETEVLALFDRHAAALQRYVASFGLAAEESEDVVQDVFLLLFRHLRLGRSRANLNGWLFQVAHNQGLKRRARIIRRRERTLGDESVRHCADPAPSQEVRLADQQRWRRLAAVVRALPERDRRCLALRSEGLRYRDIATVLGVSLGAVAKSLTRAIARLASADGR